MSADGRNPDRSPLDPADEELAASVVAAGNVPRHIAIIMDGNGRWARRRWLPRVAGHRAGRHAVRRTVQACRRLGVEVLTLYTFSQENWKRPEREVRALWSFLHETIGAEVDDLERNGVRLIATGEIDLIPAEARRALLAACERLAGNDGLTLNLALAYGGRAEIVRAAAGIARRVAAGQLRPDQVDEEAVRGQLYRPELPDPDLVVRTSGEFRLSNFLLWQVAYAEFHLSPLFWPDFRARDLILAVRDFQRRERRYGEVTGDPAADAEAAGSLLDPRRWRGLLRRDR